MSTSTGPGQDFLARNFGVVPGITKLSGFATLLLAMVRAIRSKPVTREYVLNLFISSFGTPDSGFRARHVGSNKP